MKRVLLALAFVICSVAVQAQSDVIDVTGPTDGLLLKVKSTAQINSINSPTEGLLMGNSTTKSLWYYDGTQFIDLMASAAGADWNTNLLNIPADIADGDDDTVYFAGDGIVFSSGPQINVDDTAVIFNTWDKDSSNDVILTGNQQIQGTKWFLGQVRVGDDGEGEYAANISNSGLVLRSLNRQRAWYLNNGLGYADTPRDSAEVRIYPTDEFITDRAFYYNYDNTRWEIGESPIVTQANAASLGIGSGSADNLGNHTATQTLDLGDNDIINVDNIEATGMNVQNGRITNLADPINNQDAATKAYVDANGSDDQTASEVTVAPITGLSGANVQEYLADMYAKKMNQSNTIRLANDPLADDYVWTMVRNNNVKSNLAIQTEQEGNPGTNITRYTLNYDGNPTLGTDLIDVDYFNANNHGGTDDQTAVEVPTVQQNGVTEANVQAELEKLNAASGTDSGQAKIYEAGSTKTLSLSDFVDSGNVNGKGKVITHSSHHTLTAQSGLGQAGLLITAYHKLIGADSLTILKGDAVLINDNIDWNPAGVSSDGLVVYKDTFISILPNGAYTVSSDSTIVAYNLPPTDLYEGNNAMDVNEVDGVANIPSVSGVNITSSSSQVYDGARSIYFENTNGTTTNVYFPMQNALIGDNITADIYYYRPSGEAGNVFLFFDDVQGWTSDDSCGASATTGTNTWTPCSLIGIPTINNPNFRLSMPANSSIYLDFFIYTK